MLRRACSETNRSGSGQARRHVSQSLMLVAAILALASIGGAAATQSWGAQAPSAKATSVLNVRDEGRLRFISASGSVLIDEGPASGTLPGRVRLHFTYTGSPTVSAQFTVYGAGWSIRAQGQGRLNNPTSPRPSFRGMLRITGGSGRYAHAHGTGELFGAFNRRNYGVTVQAIGKLSY
jgi:hypothetical protein